MASYTTAEILFDFSNAKLNVEGEIPNIKFIFYIITTPSFGVAVTLNGILLTTITDLTF